ncbi:Ig kappa chain V-V region K2 Precursor [Channa argus]|uniref:Ig kappa chain V-V region K2 n=1 Tax=Channa argus TaxID=215402 RepID=A0A6G1QFG1_CHAAH|nr:Ig kappa chain V-V region K2 Precursor [Channa argus]
MIRNLYRITLLLIWLHCRSLGSNVHQAPSSLITTPNGSVILSCNHSVVTYNVILWYQQPMNDSALKLIGHILYKNPTLEDQFAHHYKVTGDGSANSQLHVLKLMQPEDSGMFYCAASRHNDSFSVLPLQKPST